MRKLGADIGVLGECEEALVRNCRMVNGDVPARLCATDDDIRVHGGPRATEFSICLRSLGRRVDPRHHHHHHRFEARPDGPGAEVEASRGCPYHCTFCAKDNFRDGYRRRDRCDQSAERDRRLPRKASTYIYFIDEIFLPNRPLLEALVAAG